MKIITISLFPLQKQQSLRKEPYKKDIILIITKIFTVSIAKKKEPISENALMLILEFIQACKEIN